MGLRDASGEDRPELRFQLRSLALTFWLCAQNWSTMPKFRKRSVFVSALSDLRHVQTVVMIIVT